MSINGEFERTTYTRDQLLCLRTPGPELGQCVRTLITGDVNIRVERALDQEAVKYSTILSTYNFRQNVQTATHPGGGLLDHVITSYSASPPDVLVTDVGLSDHMLLSWSINMTPPSPTYVTI